MSDTLLKRIAEELGLEIWQSEPRLLFRDKKPPFCIFNASHVQSWHGIGLVIARLKELDATDLGNRMDQLDAMLTKPALRSWWQRPDPWTPFYRAVKDVCEAAARKAVEGGR